MLKRRQNPFSKVTKGRNIIINNVMADTYHLPNSATSQIRPEGSNSACTLLGS